ncbi:3-oxoacyl-[acyl-carrier-protein] reductase FabG [Oceanibacterium hippocampi]|uniref:3-oxoacyl-[acyl-carrier-protein] reductase FabG n=2 Tax=Oceanibacterium hippocampi TaxID=745714 RepID=A0A1Y5RA27_9PROT|nr:3-oxoacyl-[acyl-carrier-protein] reductase FabG [Oceanibacterium hippocampi]
MVLAVDRPGAPLPEAEDGILGFPMDVAAPGAAEAIVGMAETRFGGLDILFNNAGISRHAMAAELTDADWDETLAVNLSAQFRLARAAIDALRQSSAPRIINTASVMARMTDYGLVAYCASKSGVAGMTRALALDLGKYGITVNHIEPGAILTGMTETTLSQPDIAAIWAKKAALRRLGAPEDIARAALFLASDDSAFVTGHGLVVDGGLTLRT